MCFFWVRLSWVWVGMWIGYGCVEGVQNGCGLAIYLPVYHPFSQVGISNFYFNTCVSADFEEFSTFSIGVSHPTGNSSSHSNRKHSLIPTSHLILSLVTTKRHMPMPFREKLASD